MLQNLLSHKNIAMRYSTEPISMDIDSSCSHQGVGYPVTVSVAHVHDDESKSCVSVRPRLTDSTVANKYRMPTDAAMPRRPSAQNMSSGAMALTAGSESSLMWFSKVT